MKKKEKTYEEFIKTLKDYLEITGYSYSGVSDLIRNKKEKPSDILKSLTINHFQINDEIKDLIVKLNKLESKQKSINRMINNIYQILEKDFIVRDNIIGFSFRDKSVRIELKESNANIKMTDRIDIEEYKKINNNNS